MTPLVRRTAACPSCGAPIEFSAATTLLAVCASCNMAAWRTDADVEALGKVAEVTPIQSVVSLGARGAVGNVGWTCVGQIQYDHGAGPWNEWRLLLDDGTDAWLAEAQGELIFSRAARGTDAASLPPLAEIRPGTDVVVEGRAFRAVETKTARVTAVRGELTERVLPGSPHRYADLRDAKERFATISDDGTGAGAPDVFVGRVVTAAWLGIDATSVAPAAPRRVATDRFACPKCGARIVVRDAAALRFTCEACGTLFDRELDRVRVVGAGWAMAARPAIPLGATGTIGGVRAEVLAFLVRSVTVDRVRYPWNEYLLRAEDGSYRWLVQSKGHWSVTESVQGRFGGARQSPFTFEGRTYRHFQGGDAVVDHVQGEMYWRVQVGEVVASDDFVSVDQATGDVHQLSREATDDEVVWSRAAYLSPDEVVAAFPAAGKLRAPVGVAPNQPNPFVPGRNSAWKVCGLLVAVVAVLLVLLPTSCSGRPVTTFTVAAPPDAPATPEPAPADADARGVAFSPEFDLSSAHSNVEVSIHVPDDNVWVGVDGAIVEVATGEVYAFTVSAERWSGVSGGEAWTEGSGRGDAVVGGLPAGRYAIRAQAVSEGLPGGVSQVAVTVRSQVLSVGRLVLLLLLLAAPPAIVSIAALVFENTRWSESDHAAGG